MKPDNILLLMALALFGLSFTSDVSIHATILICASAIVKSINGIGRDK